MLNNKKIVVVLPAFNASRTLEKTISEIPTDIVDDIILVDDASSDNTADLANRLGIRHVVRHVQNLGYGANQKSCYSKALELKADIVVMIHPDYQYTPKLITAMASVIAYGVYPVVLGSRILGKGALKGGMPLYKYVFNRVLTLFQNLVMNQKLSEYHSGFRAFSSKVLLELNFKNNSDDFVFDNQMLAQVFFKGYEIAEITCPTRYFPEASSISFSRSFRYGAGVVWTSIQYRLARMGIYKQDIFK